MCWNATNSKWEPRTNTLDELTDVDPSGKSVGDILQFDGSNWVAVTPTAVQGVQQLDINTTLSSIVITPVAGAGTNYNAPTGF